jgi:Ca-activated chloride channel family protein
MTELHFLRPGWLLAIVPLVAAVIQLYRYKQISQQWRGVVDEALAPYVLDTQDQSRSRHAPILLALVGILSIIALAGPAWEKLAVPVFKSNQKMVVVLDLSRSMNATDIKPSRLTRAKHKLGDILQQSGDVQIGLVVFSEVPYTISPITDDMNTVMSMLPALSTDVMPVQGARVALALAHAGELLERSHATKGKVVLISDSGIDAEAFSVTQKLRNKGYILSVLSVGTQKGAPVALSDGSLLKNAQGSIVVARVDHNAFKDLAARGGGFYSQLTTDDTDLRRITANNSQVSKDQQQSLEEKLADQWLEYSPWLLPLILVLSLGLFRRGVL